MNLKRMAIAACAALIALTGCASLQNHDTAATIAVQYATAKVIEQGKTTEERLAKAQRIKAIAGEATTWLSGESVTADFLQQLALARISKLNLDTADLVLANALVQAAVLELQRKIGDGVIPPDKLTTVNELLGWISRAAELYGA